jgi:hypothetical protein
MNHKFPWFLNISPIPKCLDLQISLEKGTSRIFSIIQEFLDRNKLYLSLIQEILWNIPLSSWILPGSLISPSLCWDFLNYPLVPDD